MRVISKFRGLCGSAPAGFPGTSPEPASLSSMQPTWKRSMRLASEFVRDGGLLSYGIDRVDIFRRAATYVDRILRGAKPVELPVQFPTKFEMVVNLKTAKALGLAVPQSILLSADEVIQ